MNGRRHTPEQVVRKLQEADTSAARTAEEGAVEGVGDAAEAFGVELVLKPQHDIAGVRS